MSPALPRCIACKEALAPGQDVVFRPDGNVQHVACPELAEPAAGRHRSLRARRAALRFRLAAGALPAGRPNKTWGRYGSGHPCDACGERLSPSDVEYEIAFADAAGGLRVHPECLALWYEECRNELRGIGGGSGDVPSRVFFDRHVARDAAGAAILQRELLAASADTRALARATRARSRCVRAARALVAHRG